MRLFGGRGRQAVLPTWLSLSLSGALQALQVLQAKCCNVWGVTLVTDVTLYSGAERGGRYLSHAPKKSSLLYPLDTLLPSRTSLDLMP